LDRALQDPDSRVRRFSCLALERIGPEARTAAPALARALADNDAAVGSAASRALQRIGPGAAPGVMEVLSKDRVPRIRAAAATALPGPQGDGNIHKQVRDALLAALKDDEALVRVAAAHALSRLRMSPRDATDAVGTLTATLKDSDAQVRAAVAGVLGGLG